MGNFERLILFLVPNFLLRRILHRIPRYAFLNETISTQTPITFDAFYIQKVLGNNKDVYWPVHVTSSVFNYKNIYCGIETCPGYSPGNYIQAMGKIYVGDYTQIAPNVGIITGNHRLTDNREHDIKDVKIGKYCWLGMGAIILPGVELGDYTVVAAGSVVTKSFKEGFQVIGGNPAKRIKFIVKEESIMHESVYKYNGYIKHSEFNDYRKKFLNV
jgi:acetyltransferase-like isoleucine patch superfamily enzyme